jgi:hypothetical protein
MRNKYGCSLSERFVVHVGCPLKSLQSVDLARFPMFRKSRVEMSRVGWVFVYMWGFDPRTSRTRVGTGASSVRIETADKGMLSNDTYMRILTYSTHFYLEDGGSICFRNVLNTAHIRMMQRPKTRIISTRENNYLRKSIHKWARVREVPGPLSLGIMLPGREADH